LFNFKVEKVKEILVESLNIEGSEVERLHSWDTNFVVRAILHHHHARSAGGL